ncbi:HlyD family efflux transporter periplasmic adaptor subunit [Candidatus Kaiserbacteria bacterium]|nr:HlyD family efflux transporter periplasmic adaptor subunit [Candidatus Kaiserbacteria bacterium]
MSFLFSRHFWIYTFLVLALSAGGIFFYTSQFSGQITFDDSIEVINGNIEQTVTVSGKIEANKITRLGFPVTGTIQQVYKVAGEKVVEGDIIASITNETQIAEYNSALERLRFFEQQKKAVVRGSIDEERSVSKTNVQIAEANLAKIEAEYEQALQNARKQLLSSNLQAYPEYKYNDDVPPTISGNYLCENEGTYTISIFKSSANSNNSYKLSGLATGTFESNIDTAQPLGDCGLYIQFDADEFYRNSDWTVEIPNKRNPAYVSIKNDYDLLVTQRDNAIKLAKEDIVLAQNMENLTGASPTSEAIAQADANIAQARAQLALQEARIADFTIRSPFAGVVSAVDMKIGEPAGPQHTVTVVFEGEYELKAKVPEIDITKISVGDSVKVNFDANPEKQYEAKVTFISPVSTSVAGVSYYDAQIQLLEDIPWMREGLNADIEVVSASKSNANIVPKRFVFIEDNKTYVLKKDGEQAIKTEVKTGLTSTDGMIELLDLPIGTVILLP